MDGLFPEKRSKGMAQFFPIDGDALPAGDPVDHAYPVEKQSSKAAAFNRLKTRPNVSCEGIPLGSSRNFLHHAMRALPKFSISTQVSAPQITMISIHWCSYGRSMRGSSSFEKWARILPNGSSAIPFLLDHGFILPPPFFVRLTYKYRQEEMEITCADGNLVLQLS
jgi:hypothetical protein